MSEKGKVWTFRGHEFPTKEERDDFKEMYEDSIINADNLPAFQLTTTEQRDQAFLRRVKRFFRTGS